MNAVAALLTGTLATAVPLTGGPPIAMEFVGYDQVNDRVWVPAGNTGTIQIVEAGTGKLNVLGSFPTAPSPRPGRPLRGPSSVAIGNGVVWIGNRGDNSLLAFDSRTLKQVGSARLPAMPDALAFVSRRKEVWATTPESSSIRVVDVAGKKARPAGDISVPGSPECLAVDSRSGRVYTNLEDKDQTVGIDVLTRKVVSTWPAGCGPTGPRGLAVDEQRRALFVACTDGVGVFDLAKDGRVLDRLKTGAGVDGLEYDAGRRRLLVASAKDGILTIARLSDDGQLTVQAKIATHAGVRNPVSDKRGRVYLPDSEVGQLIVVDPESLPQTPQAR